MFRSVQNLLGMSPPVGRTIRLNLETSKSDGILKYKSSHIKWCSRGIALGTVFVPSLQYVCEGDQWHWRKAVPDVDVGQKKDVIYSGDRGWQYLGTYERVTVGHALSAVKLMAMAPNKLNCVINQTTLDSNNIPRIVRDMYRDGILMVEFFVLKCIGFNHALNLHLSSDALATQKVPKPIPIPGKTQPKGVPKKHGGKRKRGDDKNDAAPKRKKHKKL
ncbi:hypothetical protein BV22DRAFT_768133 [Leucogyrophana mollusca]|uniref:Uncharacterized protein n=1 Tax=Leucogyrophana mollusca TaxID=85980 RepID=A0ACB8B5G9_9AGAM|nr:hypothetical protein BV22DRAFT_768133 [Leucogyrophana mollusca]